jgi:hypothetical protein
MLTTGQVDHFRTFGFTVLPGHLADRVRALRAEADAAIRDADAATYDGRILAGAGVIERMRHAGVLDLLPGARDGW